MTGLIRKDIYCLRKSLKVFVLVSAGVIVLAVLFILSARYGNLARGMAEMRAENNMSEEDFYSFFRIGIWLVLCLPAAFLTMITECFKEDRRAGFSRQMLSFPLSDTKIVGSRYASCILLSMVSLVDSLFAGFIVSLASPAFSLRELAGYACGFNGVLLIYLSIVMLAIYAFGAEKTDLIQCVPFILLLIAAICIFQQQVSSMTGAQMDTYLRDIVDAVSDFLKEKWFRLYLAALICMGLSFSGASSIFKRRKGKI